MKKPALLAAALGLLVGPAAVQALTFGQIDNFEDGTVQSWAEGGISPNPPVNVATGGPAGVDDNYLQNDSSGGFGEGSKQIMFNKVQWTGDYNVAGVTAITADMANLGSTSLSMRVTLTGGPGFSQYSSTSAFVLPPDGVWRSVTFGLSSGDLTKVAGADVLAAVLANVNELRLLSSAVPAYNGDAIVSTLGVDNITATPEPGSLALLALGAAAVIRRRQCATG
jgi:hypothetical protein